MESVLLELESLLGEGWRRVAQDIAEARQERDSGPTMPLSEIARLLKEQGENALWRLKLGDMDLVAEQGPEFLEKNLGLDEDAADLLHQRLDQFLQGETEEAGLLDLELTSA
jgi:hypothetical protein